MFPITSRNSIVTVQPPTLRQNMEGYLQAIDQHLEARAQLPSWQSIEGDADAIKALVELANDKYPGLNLYTLIDGEADFGEKIRQLLDQGLSAFRLILSPPNHCHHSVAFDVRCLDGKTSVLGLEFATTRGFGAALLAAQCLGSTQRWLPEAAMTLLETDLQRSFGDCMMFSLALSKKMFTSQQAMTAVHQQNLLRQLHRSQATQRDRSAADAPGAERVMGGKRGSETEGRSATASVTPFWFQNLGEKLSTDSDTRET